jgi:hypothetical protein
MTTTVETDSDIWVHDYTTATGVQVAGHWRKRRAGSAAADDDNHPPGGDGDPTRSAAATAPSYTPQATSEPPSPPGGTPQVTPAAAARLAAAETRYKAALVSAGVSALKHRRGEDGGLQAALRERTEARAELEAARAELAQQPVHARRPEQFRDQHRQRGSGDARPAQERTAAQAAASSVPRTISAPPRPVCPPATTPA